jgi:hypothetical protein
LSGQNHRVTRTIRLEDFDASDVEGGRRRDSESVRAPGIRFTVVTGVRLQHLTEEIRGIHSGRIRTHVEGRDQQQRTENRDCEMNRPQFAPGARISRLLS